MKRITSIFILLAFFWVNNAYAESTFSLDPLSVSDKATKDSILKHSLLQKNSVDAGSAVSSIQPKKRKKVRGLLPVIRGPLNESFITISVFESIVIHLVEAFYLFRPDFVHGERGPPSLSVVA